MTLPPLWSGIDRPICWSAVRKIPRARPLVLPARPAAPEWKRSVQGSPRLLPEPARGPQAPFAAARFRRGTGRLRSAIRRPRCAIRALRPAVARTASVIASAGGDAGVAGRASNYKCFLQAEAIPSSRIFQSGRAKYSCASRFASAEKEYSSSRTWSSCRTAASEPLGGGLTVCT